jgi:hypothetical protein
MLAIAAWTATASATVRISGDNGGQIGSYLTKYSVLRKSSKRVFDGKCASACTLVVNMISRNHICVTSRAVLAFCLESEPLRCAAQHARHTLSVVALSAGRPALDRATWRAALGDYLSERPQISG